MTPDGTCDLCGDSEFLVVLPEFLVVLPKRMEPLLEPQPLLEPLLGVRWWRSLHQIQSSPETVSAAMVLPLRINLTAILLLATWMIIERARLEIERQRLEAVDEPPRLDVPHV